jgi:formate hydrogenlyase subunit 6/NADH:ubiquinone oxidoreductase subunit I
MEIVRISKLQFSSLVDGMIARGGIEVIGPVDALGGRYSFEPLEAAASLRLDYDETTLSPRKFLLPARDPLLTYATGDPASCESRYDERPRWIIGVHPGDLAAIALCDEVYNADAVDDQYGTRRRNTLFIGLYPTRSWRYRFTTSMIAPEECYRTADLMMVDLGDDSLALEIVTVAGKRLLTGSEARSADGATIELMNARKTAVPDEIALPVDRLTLPAVLRGQERHATFKTRGDKCFSCGSCVQVCPTCICFDVRDKVDLTLAAGTRYRTWDGCTLPNFATVAGGHNFRKTPADRVRHRLYRKTIYMKERYGITGCVGCGRCTRACTADIASIVEMVGDIAGSGGRHE